MHFPSHKLQLRPKLVNVLPHSTDISISKTPKASAPAKTHSTINIKDKRNIKIGIVALRTVSKWTDKAALTLEKLEGQDMSKHSQERQTRLLAGKEGRKAGRESGKVMWETETWREMVVYPVPAGAGVSREIEVRDELKMYRESPTLSKEVVYGTVKVTEVPSSQTHHAHVSTTVVEHYNESSDDGDEGKACKEIVMSSDTDIHTDTDEGSLDVSSDGEEEDSEDENESPQDSGNETDIEREESSDEADDSEEEVQTKRATNSHVKK